MGGKVGGSPAFSSKLGRHQEPCLPRGPNCWGPSAIFYLHLSPLPTRRLGLTCLGPPSPLASGKYRGGERRALADLVPSTWSALNKSQLVCALYMSNSWMSLFVCHEVWEGRVPTKGACVEVSWLSSWRSRERKAAWRRSQADWA